MPQQTKKKKEEIVSILLNEINFKNILFTLNKPNLFLRQPNDWEKLRTYR